MLYSRGFYQDIREAKETGEHDVYDLDLFSGSAKERWPRYSKVGAGCGFLTEFSRQDISAHKEPEQPWRGPVNSQHEMSTKSLPGLLPFFLVRAGSRPVPHNDLLSVIQSSWVRKGTEVGSVQSHIYSTSFMVASLCFDGPKLEVAAYVCNSSTRKAETRRYDLEVRLGYSWVLGQLGLYRIRTVLKKSNGEQRGDPQLRSHNLSGRGSRISGEFRGST